MSSRAAFSIFTMSSGFTHVSLQVMLGASTISSTEDRSGDSASKLNLPR
jgi:hypothetical protein